MSETSKSALIERVKNIGDSSQPLRFVTGDPMLAKLLAKRESIVVPKRLYGWGVEWLAEIGSIIRSRSFIASNLAYGIIGASKMVVFGQKDRSRK